MLITAAPIARLLFGVALLSLALLGVAVFVVVVFCFAWHQKQKQQRPRLVPKQHVRRGDERDMQGISPGQLSD
ncbi:hypothetical protein PMIN06_005052 [Paraphaeosphaeria minitans]